MDLLLTASLAEEEHRQALRRHSAGQLKLMQGFPADYIITRDYTGKKYSVGKQVARIGNSVVPIMAEKLVRANMEEFE